MAGSKDRQTALSKDKLLAAERRFREGVVRAMQKGDQPSGCCRYPEDYRHFSLPKAYWQGSGQIFYTYLLDNKPSVAIASVFNKNAGTEVDCFTMMIACQYRAILETIGTLKFDKLFRSDGPYPITLGTMLFLDKGERPLISKVKVISFNNLIRGDWVYFHNFDSYRNKSPKGFWKGLHAVYLGKRDEDYLFQGFTNTGKAYTRRQIYDLLIDAYNKDCRVKNTPNEKTWYDAMISKTFGLSQWVWRPNIGNILSLK